MTLFLVAVSGALIISAACSLMEATVLSLTPTQVAEISAKRPTIGAIWQRFKAEIERPIAVILILNTAAHTIGASLAGAQFDNLFGAQWIWVFSLTFTFLMLQFTEILPKTIGVRYNREMAAILAHPLSVMIRVFTPLIHLVHWINRPFEGRRDRAVGRATLEEMTALAGLARLSNQISVHQERIIRGASRLSQMRVSQVMIPVDQVAFLSTDQPLVAAVVSAHNEAHTRFPVREGDDRNRVVGYVNFKEMIYYMRTNPNDPSFRGIIRPVHFASADDCAADLLKVFVDQHVHIAIVRDEAGHTLGLVTFEDLVEELVGELEDEFDRLPRMVHALSGGMWMVGGGVTLAELRSRTGISLAEAAGTLSGWLMQRFNRLPRPGEVHHEGGAEFVIRRIRRGKVFEVAVSSAPAALERNEGAADTIGQEPSPPRP